MTVSRYPGSVVLGPAGEVWALVLGGGGACSAGSDGNQGPGIGPRDGTRVLESTEASRLRLDPLLLFVVLVLLAFRFSSFGLLEFSLSAVIVRFAPFRPALELTLPS